MIDKFAGPFEVPSGRPARGRVTAPPSKSHAIRALVCAALVNDDLAIVRLPPVPVADDIERTINSLNRLGAQFVPVSGGGYGNTSEYVPSVRGPCELDVGGSATALRFLAAVAALAASPVSIHGSRQLLRRPAGEIVPALRSLGVSVDAVLGPAGLTPPLTISGGPPKSSEVVVDASKSSHVVSALLLVGSYMPGGLTIRVRGEIASRPYINWTIDTMRTFALSAEQTADGWRCEPGRVYSPPNGREMTVVGDWSSAAFIAAAAAVSGGNVSIDGLEWESPQADRRIVDLVLDFGGHFDEPGFFAGATHRRRPLDVDLRDSPDLAPLVGALGCVASGTTRVRGAAHLRIKESDRIATVVAAARALGCEARELPDGFEIDGPAKHGGLIETRGDHRIAMAFAVAGLAIPGVVIDDPACVAKSYPGFWDDLLRLTGG